MAKLEPVIAGGSENPSVRLMRIRRELTQRGYPQLARIAQPYWNAEQAIRTYRVHHTTRPEYERND
jgi:hypothetical protein